MSDVFAVKADLNHLVAASIAPNPAYQNQATSPRSVDEEAATYLQNKGDRTSCLPDLPVAPPAEALHDGASL